MGQLHSEVQGEESTVGKEGTCKAEQSYNQLNHFQGGKSTKRHREAHISKSIQMAGDAHEFPYSHHIRPLVCPARVCSPGVASHSCSHRETTDKENQ